MKSCWTDFSDLVRKCFVPPAEIYSMKWLLPSKQLCLKNHHRHWAEALCHAEGQFKSAWLLCWIFPWLKLWSLNDNTVSTYCMYWGWIQIQTSITDVNKAKLNLYISQRRAGDPELQPPKVKWTFTDWTCSTLGTVKSVWKVFCLFIWCCLI